MIGYISLRKMRFNAFHGELAQERVVGDKYAVSLRIAYDMNQVCVSDDLNDAIDYAAVYDEVKRVMAEPRRLIETVAYSIGQRLINRFRRIETLDVSVTKYNPAIGADCDGVTASITLINDKTY